jgi:YHS domain-containing protein/thiol-disulfide isomerase/thioredoxin
MLTQRTAVMRSRTSIFALCISLLPLGLARAQEPGVQWQADLAAAKAEASKTNKLVLVHFWTPDCKPCAVLDREVFNQPQVAMILQEHFIPVKVNALADRAIADELGVTRVPTDVILSPLGQILDRSISPNAPMSYMARLAEIHTKHRNGLGTPFEQAAAQAQASQVPNAAYAQLNIPPGGSTATATAPAPSTAPAPTATAVNNPYATAPPVATQPVATQVQSVAPTATASVPPTVTPTNPHAAPPMDNRYAMNGSVTSSPAMNPYAGGMAAQTPPAQTTPPQVQQNPMAQMPATQSQGAANSAYPPTAAPNAPMQPTAQPASTLTAAMPQLPPGSPPLGFDGFCPVSMKRQVSQLPEAQWKMVRGDARFGLEHRGRVYLFASDECRREFLANPDVYSPALSGLDPVVYLEQQQSVPGTSQHGLEYKGQFYLFSSEQTMNRFRQRADLYSTGVQQAMQGTPGRMVH